MRRTLLAVAVGVAVVGGTAMHGALPAKAFTGATYTKPNCGHNYDAVRTQSAITATADPLHPWDDIASVAAVAATSPAPDSRSEVGFTITLCGAATVPDFSSAAAAASAGEFAVCMDGTGSLATSTVQTGVGHRGQPLFNGPLPASQGYKFCAQVNWQADPTGHTNTPDWGVEIFDPMTGYTFLDQAQLKDPAGNPTISPPSCGGCIGAHSFTIYMPYTWEFQFSSRTAPTPPLKSSQKVQIEQVLAPGVVVPNVVALSYIAATVTLPPHAPICSPVGVIDCIQGIGGLLTTGGSAPGDQNCTSPGTCPFNDQNGYDIGIEGVGLVGATPGPGLATMGPGLSPYQPCLATASWGAIAGQPTGPLGGPQGQDVGDAFALTGCPTVAQPGPTVSLEWDYESAYGRIIPGNDTSALGTPGKFGSPNFYHLLGQFLPSTFSFTA